MCCVMTNTLSHVIMRIHDIKGDALFRIILSALPLMTACITSAQAGEWIFQRQTIHPTAASGVGQPMTRDRKNCLTDEEMQRVRAEPVQAYITMVREGIESGTSQLAEDCAVERSNVGEEKGDILLGCTGPEGQRMEIAFTSQIAPGGGMTTMKITSMDRNMVLMNSSTEYILTGRPCDPAVDGQ